jgi:anti-sigma B factor antagonist
LITFAALLGTNHNKTERNFSQLIENQAYMKYRLDKQDRYAVLTLDEENLNSLIAPNLKSDFIFFNQEGVHNMILDLTTVKYVDSSGLSAILTAHRIWKDGGAFVITGKLQPAVINLIKLSRLENILVMIPTVSESIDYVMMEELQRELQGDE